MRFNNQAKREANMILATIRTKAGTIHKQKLASAIKGQEQTRRGQAIAQKLAVFTHTKTAESTFGAPQTASSLAFGEA